MSAYNPLIHLWLEGHIILHPTYVQDALAQSSDEELSGIPAHREYLARLRQDPYFAPTPKPPAPPKRLSRTQRAKRASGEAAPPSAIVDEMGAKIAEACDNLARDAFLGGAVHPYSRAPETIDGIASAAQAKSEAEPEPDAEYLTRETLAEACRRLPQMRPRPPSISTDFTDSPLTRYFHDYHETMRAGRGELYAPFAVRALHLPPPSYPRRDLAAPIEPQGWRQWRTRQMAWRRRKGGRKGRER